MARRGRGQPAATPTRTARATWCAARSESCAPARAESLSWLGRSPSERGEQDMTAFINAYSAAAFSASMHTVAGQSAIAATATPPAKSGGGTIVIWIAIVVAGLIGLAYRFLDTRVFTTVRRRRYLYYGSAIALGLLLLLFHPNTR